MGCDAKLIGVVDVCWKASSQDTTPTVTATMEPSTKWQPDEKLQVGHEMMKRTPSDSARARGIARHRHGEEGCIHTSPVCINIPCISIYMSVCVSLKNVSARQRPDSQQSQSSASKSCVSFGVSLWLLVRQARVCVHTRVLEELERATLCLCPKDVPLSSKAVRRQQVKHDTLIFI